jgi:hypothetical protein
MFSGMNAVIKRLDLHCIAWKLCIFLDIRGKKERKQIRNLLAFFARNMCYQKKFIVTSDILPKVVTACSYYLQTSC